VKMGDGSHTKLDARMMQGLGITRTFQQVRLFEQLSVKDNLLIVLQKRGVLGSLAEWLVPKGGEIVQELLESVGLLHKKDALVMELSYGQRKLLEIARTLGCDATHYFFDEPFAGLSTKAKERVKKIIIKLKESGKSVVLIEHDMDVIQELCDTLIVLRTGEVLAIGAPSEVLSRSEVVDAYLGH